MTRFVGLQERGKQRQEVVFNRTEDFWSFLKFSQGTASFESDQFLSEEEEATASNVSILRHPLNPRLEEGFRYLSILNDDWDSYGALAPSEQTIQMARSLCTVFPDALQPEISPTATGAVSLSWGFDASYEVVVNFDKCTWTVLTAPEADAEVFETTDEQATEEMARAFLDRFVSFQRNHA